MDSEESEIDVTELDDCLKELEAIDISDFELSDNEQNLDAKELTAHDEEVTEKTECKPLEISKETSFLPSSEVEIGAECELGGPAKINYPSHCAEPGEECKIGKSTALFFPIEGETGETKQKIEFQTDLSVTELREILKSTVDKGILEDKNTSETVVELSDTTAVVKDSVRLFRETKKEETKQLASKLMQHISHLEPISLPEITLTPKCSPKLEETPKKHYQKDKEEDDSCRLDDTTIKFQVGTILKEEVPEPVPEDSEAAVSENESTALLKHASSEASLSSCETVIFERRSPLDEQRLSRRPSSDIEEVILVKSIIQNLEALEACDSLEAISPDSMTSPPRVESVDKAVTAELSENDIDYKKERRKNRRKKKKKTKKRYDKKKKEDNGKDDLSDVSSFSSDDYLKSKKKTLRTLDYLAHCSSMKRSPSLKTHDQRSSSISPNRSLPFPSTKQLSSHKGLKRSPHSSAPLRYKPRAVHYERKSRRGGSSSSPSPSRSWHSRKRLQSAVKKCSTVTSHSPTHSPSRCNLQSRYTKKRYHPLRSRSKSPVLKRHYRRRSRSRSFSPQSRKYSITARRKYPECPRNSESPLRLSPDVRSNSPLERKLSRRLKKLSSLRKDSRWGPNSRSSSPKNERKSTERKLDFESLISSKSPKKSPPTTRSNSPLAKNTSESVKKSPSPRRSVSRQSSSPSRRISSSPVAQQPSVCPTNISPNSGPVGNPETNSVCLSKSSSPSPEKKVPPAVKPRTPSPTSVDMKTSKPEPMDISPTPETKLLKETPHPVLNTDFTKLPPVPSLVMQLPPIWSQPPPPGTLPVLDTQVLPPPPGTLPVHGTQPLPYGVQQLPAATTTQHPLPLQSQQQQQQMHNSFTYSHPQVQGIYQNGSPGFILPNYSQNNNQNSYQQQPLYGQSRPAIGCQTFTTFPQVSTNSSNPVGHSTQFQSTYDSPVNRQNMSVPPPVYNQPQKYQPNLVPHNVAQYPPQAGNHTAPYVMQSGQQVPNIIQSPQNTPQSQTQMKINVQQVLHSQNTSNQSLSRTSPYPSCRDPRLKDNISVSCENPIPVPSVATRHNTAIIDNQSSASLTQKVLTLPQSPLPGQPPLPPGQPPLPPGQPPLPPGQPPLPPGQPPLPPGQPPLPPGQPPLPPKEMKIEQPPLPISPPPPSTPPPSIKSEVQEENSKSSTAQPQKPSPLVSHLKKLLPSKNERSQEVESVTTIAGALFPTENENGSKSEAFSNRTVTTPVCSATVHCTNSLISTKIGNIASSCQPLVTDNQLTSENKYLSAVTDLLDKNISGFISSVIEKRNSKSSPLTGSANSDSQRETAQEQRPEYQKNLNECICEKTGVEKKLCLKCLYKKRKVLEPASVFSGIPKLSRCIKRPIVVNLLNKRKTQPVTAIVKPNVHEIQTSSSCSEQPHQQESASYSNSPYSETGSRWSTESVPVLTEQRTDKHSGDICNDKSNVIVQKTSCPGHQTKLTNVDTPCSPKNSDEFSGIIKDVAIDQISVSHNIGSPIDSCEKIVPEGQTHNFETEQHTRKPALSDEHTSEIKERIQDTVVLKQMDVSLSEVKSSSVQMKNENSLKNKYLTSVITGNKWNKKISAAPRSYRSKSADCMLDSLQQSAKEYAKVPKDDVLQLVGNSSLMHDADTLRNNTQCPTEKREENQNETNTSVSFTTEKINEEKNYTKKPVSKHQISLSGKVEESDTLHNREVSAASGDQKLEDTVLMAHIPNNNGKLDYVRPKTTDICLSETKLEDVTERITQDIFGSSISVKKESLESDAGGAEEKSKRLGEMFTTLDSTGGVHLGSLCCIEKTMCHWSVESLNDNPTSPCTKLKTEKLNTTTEVSSDNSLKSQNPSKHLNSNVATSVIKIECNSSDSAVCSWEKAGNTNMQNKPFKNEKSDPSVVTQTGRQSLQVVTEHCRQDEEMCIAIDSAPVTHGNVLKRPTSKDSSCVEDVKVAITAVSDDKVLDSLENVQQPAISHTQNKSQAKDTDSLFDNDSSKINTDLKVAQSLQEKSLCHIDEVMLEKPLKKIVKSEEQKDDIIQTSYLSERAVNVSVSDSSDCDIIELPTTIDLCLSDDADDLHEVPVSPKVLPIVDITNEKPVVMNDSSECITIDGSPEKEIPGSNVESMDVTPSISSATIIASQENCVSVTDSMLPAEPIPELLDETPCLNRNLCKSSIQTEDKSLLQMKPEEEMKLEPKMSSDRFDMDMSLQPRSPLEVDSFVNNRGEVTPTKPDIFRSSPPSKPFINDTLLSRMKPAPRSVKLHHAALLQDRHVHNKILDLYPVKRRNKSLQKIEWEKQNATRDTETKDRPSFSEENFKGGHSQNKRNSSVLSGNSNNENGSVTAVSYADVRGEINEPSNTQEGYGEPCLKKRRQSPLIRNNEQTESNETVVSITSHPKNVQKSTLSVTVLQPISIVPSESREGTLSSQVQRHSSRILRSPKKNTVIFAKYVGGTDFMSNEEDCSNEDIASTQVERIVSKSENTIKKYPHRSQLPSYALTRRVLISRLRRCPVVLQANFKKMAKLLRQDSKLTQIPLVVLEQMDLQLKQNKKITQNLDLQTSTTRCCCCQVLCRSIATQTDSSHMKQN
ncbi:uncharacterized protein LOC124611132 [Schistocerca americana]|uniref:uncharacterized protein LOC124611132 n=1 Tax=Schistocerca americana TaxID=7009 RepID=UPI001F502A0A|nr:uncharacterized protein LOC124611132 [Schistocerca americana]